MLSDEFIPKKHPDYRQLRADLQPFSFSGALSGRMPAGEKLQTGCMDVHRYAVDGMKAFPRRNP